uniref:Uncharacterized protein n=1 Tax=Arundo donax TaxID=35708 RepID=A0A0A8XZX0_ARUDO
MSASCGRSRASRSRSFLDSLSKPRKAKQSLRSRDVIGNAIQPNAEMVHPTAASSTMAESLDPRDVQCKGSTRKGGPVASKLVAMAASFLLVKLTLIVYWAGELILWSY